MEKHIILLHGALGSRDQLKLLAAELGQDFNVHSFNFNGHGGESIPDHLLMNNLVQQLTEHINANIQNNAHLTLFGYSMGGYVALLLACRNICKIDHIITLGTKFFWDKEVAEKEIKLLNPSLIEEKIPAFARELEQRHHPQDWKRLLKITTEMMIDLGANQYLNDEMLSQLIVPCKLMIGDQDKMVSLEETLHFFRKIKSASLSVLPSTPHPIEKANLNRLVFELRN